MKYKSYKSGSDSMVLTFNFEDGDGDIGLSSTQTYYPYQPFNVVVDSRDTLVTYSATDIVPPLYLVDPTTGGNRTLFSDNDNRPPYNCKDYLIQSSDTFYIQKNPYHNNFHIQYQRKRNGVYTKIDFASEFGNTNCDVVDFNGRIPVFDPENIGNTLTGSISYAMISAGFPIVLRQDTFRVVFYIYDQALNESNIVNSPDMTLKKITIER